MSDIGKKPVWVAVLEIAGLQAEEYDAIVRRMNVEQEPAAGIYAHFAAPFSDAAGIRVIELWDDKDGFESFIQQRMLPTAAALGIERQATVTITPLLNAFAPRVNELDGLRQTRVK